MAKELIRKIYHNKIILFESFVIFLLIIFSATVLAINIQAFSRDDIKVLFGVEAPEKDSLTRNICYISGQVNNPGVYEFTEDTRLAELVELAGGFTDKADLDFVNRNANLAQKLTDEYFIYIPSIEERNAPTQSVNGPNTNSLININTASEAELDTLPGVGPSTAQKIIENRPYGSIDELLDVSGIGDAKFNDIKNLIGI